MEDSLQPDTPLPTDTPRAEADVDYLRQTATGYTIATGQTTANGYTKSESGCPVVNTDCNRIYHCNRIHHCQRIRQERKWMLITEYTLQLDTPLQPDTRTKSESGF